MFVTDVVILAGARTPMARYMGSIFDATSAIDLALPPDAKRFSAPEPIHPISTM